VCCPADAVFILREQHKVLKEKTRQTLLKAIKLKKSSKVIKRILRFWERHLVIEQALFQEWFVALESNEFCETKFCFIKHDNKNT